MNLLRKTVSWLFGLQALTYLFLYGVMPFLQYPPLFATWNLSAKVRTISFEIVYIGLATVLAIGWWTTQRSSGSAKIWGLSASVVDLLYWVPTLFFMPRIQWGSILPMEIAFHVPVGLAGLVAFAGAATVSPVVKQRASSISAVPEGETPKGDGTLEWANQSSGSLFLIGIVVSCLWWNYWIMSKRVPFHGGAMSGALLLIVTIFAADALLQLANTIVGLALGLSPGLFAIGPFVWTYRNGTYEFKFEPAHILSLGGVSEFLPSRTGFNPALAVSSLAAGPIVTLYTGVLSLWIAFASAPDSPLQLQGFLALFGANCILFAVVYLTPYRKGSRYSPGAIMIQILRGGSWAEFHQVRAQALSTLKGPVRPRDFDIDRIRRVEKIITSGPQALLLRLYAFDHFLDSGQFSEAGAALQEAIGVYQGFESNIPAALHTPFIFGSAYVYRDAAAAREWWDRMEAKGKRPENVDYWRAKAALHWIEGNREQADGAWKESHQLAQQLPSSGIYDFDRYCCDLLRKAMDDTPAH